MTGEDRWKAVIGRTAELLWVTAHVPDGMSRSEWMKAYYVNVREAREQVDEGLTDRMGHYIGRRREAA